MAAMVIAPGAAFAPKMEDLRRLQVQVDQLRERLDFVSSMLPLANFSHDYFQKVECEASVQLLRLRQNAQIPQPPDENDAELEMVKWLHFTTDAVMSLHSAYGEDAVSDSPLPCVERRPWRAATASEASLPSSFEALSMGNVSRSLGAALRGCGGCMNTGGNASQGVSSVAGSGIGSRGPADASEVSLTSGLGQMQRNSFALGGPKLVSSQVRSVGGPAQGAGRSFLPGGVGLDLAHVPPGSATKLPYYCGSVGSGAKPTVAQHLLQSEDSRELAEPFAEPDTKSTHSGEVLDNITLGKGSWARAYHQAKGPKRDALTLLYNSGIVTSRELADDNTVISEEHINECVSIASEMLQTCSMEMWVNTPQEAKTFFEARLTALYQRKFGEEKVH